MKSIVLTSTSVDTETAVAEIVAGLTVEMSGSSPDLVVVFATDDHVAGLESASETLRSALNPACLIGTTAGGIVGDDHEIENGAALVVFAAVLPGVVLEPFHMAFEQSEETGRIRGFPFDSQNQDDHGGALLFGDPFTFPMDVLLRVVNERRPGLPLFGGMASGGSFPGSNRLLLDDAILDEGAVGVLISGNVVLKTVVSQGCRPVGRHFVVTKGGENVIEELGGRPALGVLQELLDSLDDEDRELLRGALHIGRATDEYRSEFKRGDFLVRSVTGVDRARGAFAINDSIRRGQTVQFHVRDPASASEDLELLLEEQAPFFAEHPPVGALLFSCNGRGTHMFSAPDHDLVGIHQSVEGPPVAGFFAAGEIGPVGGQNFLHGFTASMAFFCRPADAE